MVLRETLARVGTDQRRGLPVPRHEVPREVEGALPARTPAAIVLSGVRRCGKSTLLRQLMRRFPRSGYLDFEDPRLLGLSAADLPIVSEVLEEQAGPRGAFFLDEVQQLPGWEHLVRYQVDRGRRVFLTGSNASLLGRELGSKLTGRHLRVELFPFSYPEFLALRGEDAGRPSLERYVREGGFPGFLRAGREELLRELFQDIVSRDVLLRHPVRELRALREIAIHFMSHVGQEVSFRALTQTYGLRSPTTASHFFGFLEDSYLVQGVQVHDASMRRRELLPRKVYAIDTGLARATSTSFSEDRGSALENAVYLHLRRRYRDIFYYRDPKGRGECDFVVRDRGRVFAVYQVCWELRPDNLAREAGGLARAMEALDVDRGAILTLHQDESVAWERRRYAVVPCWKWMGAGPGPALPPGSRA